MGYGLPMQQIKAVIFDLGETLLNFGRVDVNEQFYKGARLTYSYLKDLFGSGGKLPKFSHYRLGHVATIRWQVLKARMSRREFDCLAILDHKLKVMGLRASSEQITDLAQLWYQPLQSCATIEAGLHHHLQALHDMSLKLAILSNTFLPAGVMDRHLSRFELLGYFPVRLYSSDTIYRKPDRRVFHEAVKQLNVSPAEAVMVGDQPGMDIRGARRAGLNAVFKRGAGNRRKRIERHIPVIDTIGELPTLLRHGSHEWMGSRGFPGRLRRAGAGV